MLDLAEGADCLNAARQKGTVQSGREDILEPLMGSQQDGEARNGGKARLFKVLYEIIHILIKSENSPVSRVSHCDDIEWTFCKLAIFFFLKSCRNSGKFRYKKKNLIHD